MCFGFKNNFLISQYGLLRKQGLKIYVLKKLLLKVAIRVYKVKLLYYTFISEIKISAIIGPISITAMNKRAIETFVI